MYIQVIRGKATDAGDIKAAVEKWHRDLAPGATGYLGSTGGVTDDQTLVSVVRFESADAARRNSERPEQDAWWTETSKLFSGEVTFYDCPTVDVGLGGGSDKAGFVQIMVNGVKDVAKARELSKKFIDAVPSMRPDVMGFTDAYTDDGTCISTTYFTSEAEAREAEKRDMPAETAAMFEQFQALMVGETEFLDLPKPWYFSA